MEMKKIVTKQNRLKVRIILQKKGKKVFIYPSIRKTQFFLRNKAKSYLKNGYFITIRVIYPDGFQNAGTYNKIKDLFWAFKAFIKEYLE